MEILLLLLLGAIVAAVAFVWGIVSDARHPSRATAGWALGRGLPVDPADCKLLATDELWGLQQPAWRIQGGDPRGPVTVIVHGWRRSRIDSLRRVSPWWSVSSEIWLLDLEGHGDSPAGPTSLGSSDVPALVALIHDLAAPSLSRSNRPSRVLLVGHSLGATIALRAAAQLDEASLAGLVAFAPYESLREPLGCRLRAGALPSFPFAIVAEVCLHALCGREGSTQVAMKRLNEMKVPTLLLAAEHDAVVSLAHVRKLASASGLSLEVDPEAMHDDLGTSLANRPDSATAKACAGFLEQIRQRMTAT